VPNVFTPIDSLHGALDYHLERHNVLMSNVAHVDTPGYRPVDLGRVEDAGSFEAVLGVAMAKTSPTHLTAPDGAAGSASGYTFEDLAAGAGRDGNYVSLDREAAKVAANHIRYDVVSAVASAELKQLMFAANDGKG
jgi:flagellar basal-body rod protein FlgB